MKETIRLALVDDQKLFRESLSILLGARTDYQLVMQAENGKDCLDQLKSLSVHPHIVLMDMEMPLMDGIELNEEIQKHYPEIKTIILSVFSKERLIARMIEAGASGYLFKNCGKEELFTAIDGVFTKGFHINAEVMKAIQNKSTGKRPANPQLNNMAVELTPRETEILHYICKEYSNAQIAEALCISIRTVEGHRNNLLLKTACRNTAGLALFAVKHNIFEILH